MSYYAIIFKNSLFHHGIKGQKWGVRNGPPYPLRESFTIHKSVGSKAWNYKVHDYETDEDFEFTEGTKVDNIQTFAGKGSNSALRKRFDLAESYGGKPENWKHRKGIGYLDFYGESRKAEVHWMQEETAGKHEFKVKKWLE